MRPAVPLIALVAAAVAGCAGDGKTTRALSSDFGSLAERQAYLERYVTFRRDYRELQFSIAFWDGGGGALPSPSEWDIRVYAVVPAEGVGAWARGLAAASQPGLDWVSQIPGAPADFGAFAWFADGGGVIVGIDEATGGVLYRNVAR